jgi:hypothetical protein
MIYPDAHVDSYASSVKLGMWCVPYLVTSSKPVANAMSASSLLVAIDAATPWSTLWNLSMSGAQTKLMAALSGRSTMISTTTSRGAFTRLATAPKWHVISLAQNRRSGTMSLASTAGRDPRAWLARSLTSACMMD